MIVLLSLKHKTKLDFEISKKWIRILNQVKYWPFANVNGGVSGENLRFLFFNFAVCNVIFISLFHSTFFIPIFGHHKNASRLY